MKKKGCLRRDIPCELLSEVLGEEIYFVTRKDLTSIDLTTDVSLLNELRDVSLELALCDLTEIIVVDLCGICEISSVVVRCFCDCEKNLFLVVVEIGKIESSIHGCVYLFHQMYGNTFELTK